jgi:hypothetical protein
MSEVVVLVFFGVCIYECIYVYIYVCVDAGMCMGHTAIIPIFITVNSLIIYWS